MNEKLKTPLFQKIASAILILVIGGVLTSYFIMTKKETHKKEENRNPSAVLVQTQSFSPQDHVIEISVLGQVIPALETTIQSQVSGEIIKTAQEFVPGGYFEKGSNILNIDPANYTLDIKKKEALIKQAKADLALEMGRQEIAKDELAIIKRTTNAKLKSTDLALRKPQLEQAQANLDQAKADLEITKLNLARTTLKAPFNGLIIERNANLGDIVTNQTTLAKLVSTDEYWVEISVPVHDMVYLKLPHKGAHRGSKAKIIMDAGRGTREGQLIRMTGSLDQQSRLVTMLVSVPDPLLRSEMDMSYKLQIKNMQGADIYTQETRKPPLVLGDYVKVVLQGKRIKNTVRLPVSTLRDDHKIWIAKDKKLEIRTVKIAYQDRDYAYIIGGLGPKDQIITSNIPIAVNGMAVRMQEQTKKTNP